MPSSLPSNEGFLLGLGIRLHYVELGPPQGTPVVLLPGWPQTAYAWRLVAPLLAAEGYRTLAIDLPGQGTSDLLPEGTPYETHRVAEIVADALRSSGITRAHLVSHDVGAWVAFTFCGLYPAFAHSLTLIETQIMGISPEPHIQQAARAFQFFFNSVPGLGELLTAGHERAFLDFLFRHKLGRQEAISDVDLDEYMRAYGDPKRMSAGFEYYRAVPANMERDSKAAKLTIPTLAVGAEKGVGSALLEAIRPHADNVRGTVLAGFGHYLPEEAPGPLAEQLLRFFHEAESIER